MVAVLVAALALVLGGLVATGVASSKGRIGAAAGSIAASHQNGLRSYQDVTGWRMLYPASFHIEISEHELRLSIIEVTIANFRSRAGVVVRTYPGGGNVRAVPPLNHAGSFPADGVALRVVADQGAPSGLKANTRLRYPLSVARFRPSHARPSNLLYNATTGETLQAGRYHRAPRSLAQHITVRGDQYALVIWIGPKATAGQRQSLARIVASLRFQKPTHDS